MTLEEEVFLKSYEPSKDIVCYYKDSQIFKRKTQSKLPLYKGKFPPHRGRISAKRKFFYVDANDTIYTGEKVLLTPYLVLTIRKASMLLDTSTSTLSKLWKKISKGKRWPYLALRKKNRQIDIHQRLLLRNAAGEKSESQVKLKKEMEILRQKRKSMLPECYILRVWLDGFCAS